MDEQPRGVEDLGLGRGLGGSRVPETEQRRLATRVGLVESLVDDGRVRAFVSFEIDRLGPLEHGVLDPWLEVDGRREATGRAQTFLQSLGAGFGWLAEELVSDIYRTAHAAMHGLDVARVRRAWLTGLLAGVVDGYAPEKLTVPPFARAQKRSNAENLEAFRAWRGAVDSYGAYLELEADRDPAGKEPGRGRSVSSSGRRDGRCYYWLRVAQPPLAAVEVAEHEFSDAYAPDDPNRQALIADRTSDVYAAAKRAEGVVEDTPLAAASL